MKTMFFHGAVLALSTLCLLPVATASCRADDGGKDYLPKHPWVVTLGSFGLTDSAVASQGGALSLSAKYNFSTLGSRRQNEDGVSLFLGFTSARATGEMNTEHITMIGALYEHTWGFGSGYYTAMSGLMNTTDATAGVSANLTDFALGSRLGVYFDRKQTFGLETGYLNGGRKANTGIFINLVGRF